MYYQDDTFVDSKKLSYLLFYHQCQLPVTQVSWHLLTWFLFLHLRFVGKFWYQQFIWAICCRHWGCLFCFLFSYRWWLLVSLFSVSPCLFLIIIQVNQFYYWFSQSNSLDFLNFQCQFETLLRYMLEYSSNYEGEFFQTRGVN